MICKQCIFVHSNPFIRSSTGPVGTDRRQTGRSSAAAHRYGGLGVRAGGDHSRRRRGGRGRGSDRNAVTSAGAALVNKRTMSHYPWKSTRLTYIGDHMFGSKSMCIECIWVRTCLTERASKAPHSTSLNTQYLYRVSKFTLIIMCDL